MMKPLCTLVVILTTILFTTKATPLKELTTSSRYYVSQSQLTFIEAMIDCKTRNMDMGRIENETVFTDLTKHLQDLGVSDSNRYWLGGLRRKNGEWVWIETQEVVKYTNWADGQPDVDDDNDFCLQLGLDIGEVRPFEWEAQTSQSHRYYICQFSDVPLSPTTTTTTTKKTTPTSKTTTTPKTTTTSKKPPQLFK